MRPQKFVEVHYSGPLVDFRLLLETKMESVALWLQPMLVLSCKDINLSLKFARMLKTLNRRGLKWSFKWLNWWSEWLKAFVGLSCYANKNQFGQLWVTYDTCTCGQICVQSTLVVINVTYAMKFYLYTTFHLNLNLVAYNNIWHVERCMIQEESHFTQQTETAVTFKKFIYQPFASLAMRKSFRVLVKVKKVVTDRRVHQKGT